MEALTKSHHILSKVSHSPFPEGLAALVVGIVVCHPHFLLQPWGSNPNSCQGGSANPYQLRPSSEFALSSIQGVSLLYWSSMCPLTGGHSCIKVQALVSIWSNALSTIPAPYLPGGRLPVIASQFDFFPLSHSAFFPLLEMFTPVTLLSTISACESISESASWEAWPAMHNNKNVPRGLHNEFCCDWFIWMKTRILSCKRQTLNPI